MSGISKRGMRYASDVKHFPYALETMAYVLVSPEGIVAKSQTIGIRDLLGTMKETGGTLLAAWPGAFRTDVFVVDSIEDLLDALEGVPSSNEDKPEPTANEDNPYGCKVGVCIDANTGYHNFNLHR